MSDEVLLTVTSPGGPSESESSDEYVTEEVRLSDMSPGGPSESEPPYGISGGHSESDELSLLLSSQESSLF